MSEEAVVDAALEAAHRAIHALHATGCIRDRGAQDCPLLPDLRVAITAALQSTEQYCINQGRIQGLEEAANEVHIEGRWQQEQVQTARKGGKSMRSEFVERLLMVETILIDRVKSLAEPSEPDLTDRSVGWDDPDHERRHRKAGIDWPCRYGQAECPIR